MIKTNTDKPKFMKGVCGCNCHCCTEDCFAYHESKCEHCDTTTQGVHNSQDNLGTSLHNSEDKQIQTKGESIHPEKDRYKPVEGGLKEKHLTGNKQGDSGSIEGRLDDSMKEQIEEILNYNFYEAWNGTKHDKNPEIAAKISALSQSQHSKTLERVRMLRSDVPDDGYKPGLVTSPEAMGPYRMYNKAIDDVLAILEAEQKGTK